MLRPRHGSVAIDCHEPLCVPEEWYDEETIRGDVLAATPRIGNEPGDPAGVGGVFARRALPMALTANSRTIAPPIAAPLLLAASKLGMEMLHLGENDGGA